MSPVRRPLIFFFDIKCNYRNVLWRYTKEEKIMALIKCPDCGKEIKLFGESHIDEVASELAMQVLGKMPLDPAYAELADQGLFYKADNPYLEDAVKKIENM